jgi:hypothetical protein
MFAFTDKVQIEELITWEDDIPYPERDIHSKSCEELAAILEVTVDQLRKSSF